MTLSRRSILVIGCVAVLGAALAIAYGTPFGTKNQNTYVLDALVRAFPELYRKDWFVTEAHHYHAAFAYVTAPLFWLDADGAIAFGIAQIVVMVATMAAIYVLVAEVTERARLIVFLGIAGLLALDGQRALGGSYLFTGYLQPSSLATVGWLVALIFWMRERPLYAGLALAAGAAFHLNSAVLGIGIFGACELATTRRFDIRRLAALLVPSLAVVLVFLPMMLASSRADNSKQALDVLVQFVFPGHFKPSRVRLELFSLVGWHVIALAIRPAGTTDARAKLFWFAMVTMGSCIMAVVLVQIPPLLPLTRLFVWRIAPFGILGAQILLFVWVRDVARGERALPDRRELVALVLGASLIIYNAFTRRREIYPEVISAVMAALVLAVAVRREHVVTALCAALCALALWIPRDRLVAPVVFDTVSLDAFRWARTSTDRDAVFLIPPYFSEWRLATRRAIVVDDKSPPMYMSELVAWYHRLCDSVGATSLQTLGAGWRRWDALTPEGLVAIAHKFHADYVVLEKHRSAARLTAAIAYEDADVVVYAITNE